MTRLSDGRAEIPFAKEHQSLQALGLDGLDNANAFKFGLLAGRITGVTPPSRSRRRTVAVYSGSRSTIPCSTPLRSRRRHR